MVQAPAKSQQPTSLRQAQFLAGIVTLQDSREAAQPIGVQIEPLHQLHPQCAEVDMVESIEADQKVILDRRS